jgi:hypothetical protein
VAVELISYVSRLIVPFGLVVALALFGSSAIRSKTLRSLPAQLSVFVIIWVVAELLRSLLLFDVIRASPELQLVGLVIHTVSMIAFGLFIVTRYYRHSKGA